MWQGKSPLEWLPNGAFLHDSAYLNIDYTEVITLLWILILWML